MLPCWFLSTLLHQKGNGLDDHTRRLKNGWKFELVHHRTWISARGSLNGLKDANWVQNPAVTAETWDLSRSMCVLLWDISVESWCLCIVYIYIYIYKNISLYIHTGSWLGTFFIFPYIGNNHPNWQIFFRGVETTNQHRFQVSFFLAPPQLVMNKKKGVGTHGLMGCPLDSLD